MSGLNKALIIGRVGRAPELKPTNRGGHVANFTVASNETWTDKTGTRQEKTEWHRVVVYNKLAEVVHKYLTKGSQIYVEGRIQTREWQDANGQKRYVTEVIADDVTFLGGKNSAAVADGVLDSLNEPPEGKFSQSFDDDEIPF
jgi:single-strand DNA-binding protein